MQARRRAVNDIERRQSRLVSPLEVRDDPEGTRFVLVHERPRVLEGERKVKIDELRELEKANPAGREQAPELLDSLRVLDVDLAALPVEVRRRLLEAFRLEVRYDTASPSHRPRHVE